jgi:RNA polymerase sporulation-specific sigma factor
MFKYKEYNDFELLYLICEQDEDAYEILYNKYKSIVDLKAKKYVNFVSNKGLDYNDLVQEGMIGLSEAIRDFKIDKEIKFSTFANLCIERQINTAIIKANRKKYKALNDSVSLDEKFSDNDCSLFNFIFDNNEKDPGNYLVDIETRMETYNKIKTKLTALERKVFDLKINNFEYKEIAMKLGKSYKSVDSALQRIKNKLQKIEKEKIDTD